MTQKHNIAGARITPADPLPMERRGQDENRSFQVLASAIRTATVNSSEFTNRHARGVHVAINVTLAATSTSVNPSITPKIQAKNPVSSGFYDLLTGAAITATGTTVLKVYPGLTPSTNVVVNDVLPRPWRVRVEHGTTAAITYSVGANEVQ